MEWISTENIELDCASPCMSVGVGKRRGQKKLSQTPWVTTKELMTNPVPVCPANTSSNAAMAEQLLWLGPVYTET